MATLLKKDVSRETYSLFSHRGRKVIVTLKAGDMLEFREKGSSLRYEVPLKACMHLAFIQHLEDRYKMRMKKYKERKSMGLRAKRPKAPVRAFNKKFYRSLSKK